MKTKKLADFQICIGVPLRQNPTQVLPYKLLKGAIIHFYCLLDESCFSDICTIIELKELS